MPILSSPTILIVAALFSAPPILTTGEPGYYKGTCVGTAAAELIGALGCMPKLPGVTALLMHIPGAAELM